MRITLDVIISDVYWHMSQQLWGAPVYYILYIIERTGIGAEAL